MMNEQGMCDIWNGLGPHRTFTLLAFVKQRAEEAQRYKNAGCFGFSGTGHTYSC